MVRLMTCVALALQQTLRLPASAVARILLSQVDTNENSTLNTEDAVAGIDFINSLGAGAGIDTKALVSSLVEAERAGKEVANR